MYIYIHVCVCACIYAYMHILIGASVSEPHTCHVNAIFSVCLSVPYVVPKLNINSRITKNSHVRKIATPTTLFTRCVLLNCMLPSLCNSTYSYVLAHARPTMRCSCRCVCVCVCVTTPVIVMFIVRTSST